MPKLNFIINRKNDETGSFYIAKLDTKSLGHRLKGRDFQNLNEYLVKNAGAAHYYSAFGGWKFNENPAQKLSSLEINLFETYRKSGRPVTKEKKEKGGIIETSNGKNGGIVKGKPHTEGGVMAIVVTDNDRPVELQGHEAIIVREAMQSDKLYDFEGEKLTAKEIASRLNVEHGGVELMGSGGVVNNDEEKEEIKKKLLEIIKKYA